MPVALEAPIRSPSRHRTSVGQSPTGQSLRIGLINNMPDTALQSTEAQFCGLLTAAAGTLGVTVRLSAFPELPRGAEAAARIAAAYWPLEDVLREPLDALIVTGTEPRAARLSEEPYWPRFAQLLEFARTRTYASIWSCLAAHAAVEVLDGVQRQRLAEKRCGIYRHDTLADHALLAGATAPLYMPHSRWNELPVGALRQAGYTLLSWSAESGADTFIRDRGSLHLFFQGHPEYEDVTLLKEYRRDVGRYLSGTQAHYPTLPAGYLAAASLPALEAFKSRALAQRDPALLAEFPFAEIAAKLENSWAPSAVALYRNWLGVIVSARRAARRPEPVSLSSPTR